MKNMIPTNSGLMRFCWKTKLKFLKFYILVHFNVLHYSYGTAHAQRRTREHGYTYTREQGLITLVRKGMNGR